MKLEEVFLICHNAPPPNISLGSRLNFDRAICYDKYKIFRIFVMFDIYRYCIQKTNRRINKC